MKVSAIIIAVVIAVAGFFVTRNMTGTIDETLKRADRTLDLIERLESIITANSAEIDFLLIQLSESDRKIDSLTGLVSGYAATIANINQQISELPTFDVPDISYVHPDTYEECLVELELSRNTSEQLTEIVGIQSEHIRLLEAANVNQQLIIETQRQTIEIHHRDNQALRDAYDDMIRDANRRKWIGYIVGALGIAVALL